MNSRDLILNSARCTQPPARPLPAVPRFDEGLGPLLTCFKETVERMGGKLADPAVELNAWMAKRYPDARVVCSATAEVSGNRDLAGVAEPKELKDVDLGVVRAAFGVAETGSVYLGDRAMSVNALGYLAQHLLVLLDPADIVGNLHHAFARAEFAEAQ